MNEKIEVGDTVEAIKDFGLVKKGDRGKVYTVASIMFDIRVDWTGAGSNLGINYHNVKLVSKKQFSKSDLRTGMQVRTEDGLVSVVMLNASYKGGDNDVLVDIVNTDFLELSYYNEDMTYSGNNSKYDIVSVYLIDYLGDLCTGTDDCKSIWKREPKNRLSNWYTVRNSPESIFYCGENISFGIGLLGHWFVNNYGSESLATHELLTEEEVGKRLIELAVEKGYKEGVTVNRSNQTDEDYRNMKLTAGRVELRGNELRYIYTVGESIGWFTLMKDGVWADIIPEQIEYTMKELEDKLGHKIKIVK